MVSDCPELSVCMRKKGTETEGSKERREEMSVSSTKVTRRAQAQIASSQVKFHRTSKKNTDV